MQAHGQEVKPAHRRDIWGQPQFSGQTQRPGSEPKQRVPSRKSKDGSLNNIWFAK